MALSTCGIPWKITCSGVRSSCVSVTMESLIALAIMALSCALFSAASHARPAVMSLNTIKLERPSCNDPYGTQHDRLH